MAKFDVAETDAGMVMPSRSSAHRMVAPGPCPPGFTIEPPTFLAQPTLTRGVHRPSVFPATKHRSADAGGSTHHRGECAMRSYTVVMLATAVSLTPAIVHSQHPMPAK